MKARDIEKEVIARKGWKWANFYDTLKNIMKLEESHIEKNGTKYSLQGDQDNGQNSIQQEEAAV